MLFEKWCEYTAKSNRPKLPIIITAIYISCRLNVMSIFNLVPIEEYIETIVCIIMVCICCLFIVSYIYIVSWIAWMAIYDVIDYINRK